LRFHYESAEAQLLSWQDTMQGPDFFDRNIDMANRRARIKTLIQNEAWQDVCTLEMSERKRFTRLPRWLRHYLGIFTLNGHLVPFSALLSDRIVLGIEKRGKPHQAFGASQIVYLNTAQTKGYTVTQSKRRFFSICWRVTKTLVQFLRHHSQIKADYRHGYKEMTKKNYWQQKLHTVEDILGH